MLSKTELTMLTNLGRLADKDIHARPITITPEEGGLVAQYHGTYIGGVVHVACNEPISEAIAVDAKAFLELAAPSFPNGASLSILPNDLKLSYNKHDLKLKLFGVSLYDPAPNNNYSSFTVDGPAFRDNISDAANFCSKSTAQILYTGVRVKLKGNQLDIIAYNGIEIFREQMPCTSTSPDCEVTLTGEDAALAISVLLDNRLDKDNRTITVRFLRDARGDTNRVVFISSNGEMQLSALTGKWPAVEQILDMPLSEYKIELSDDVLSSILRVVRVLDSKHERQVMLTRVDDNTVEISASGEGGEDHQEIEGRLPLAKLALQPDALQRVQIVGRDVTLYVPADETKPLLFSNGKTRLDCVSRVYIPPTKQTVSTETELVVNG